MNKKITIAIDAMGGDNSPDKTIEGLNLFLKNTKESDYLINLFGDEIKIKEKLKKYKILSNVVNIIHTKSVVSDEETPLTAIKNSKNTCYVLSIGIYKIIVVSFIISIRDNRPNFSINWIG